jgi:hypothetical protein
MASAEGRMPHNPCIIPTWQSVAELSLDTLGHVFIGQVSEYRKISDHASENYLGPGQEKAEMMKGVQKRPAKKRIGIILLTSNAKFKANSKRKVAVRST